MKRPTLTWKMAQIGISLSLSLGLGVNAQATPSQTWTPAASCTNGLPTPTASNGTYIDGYGANWAVYCGQDNTGAVYDAYEGTNGEGIFGCFEGCDQRPGCTAFSYSGTVAGPNSGAGRCYYKMSAGAYYTNSSVYAAANLISNGTPNKPCPYYNGTTYADLNGIIYQIYCGYDGGGGTGVGTHSSSGMDNCMAQCDLVSGCTSFSYTYTGSEPGLTGINTDGTCYFKSGTASVSRSSNVAVAVRVGSGVPSSSSVSPYTGPTTTVTTTTTTASSSSGSSSAQACTGTISPSTPACPAASGLSFVDACGTNYTVYCANDTNPGAVYTATVPSNNIAACMQACDNYPGCQAATLQGTACYIKTAFSSLASGSNGLVALVRYIPPNPNFAAPPASPCQNCSTGCGSALPSILSPNGPSQTFALVNPSDGLLRNWTIHIPKYYDPNHASPLIMAFPGNGEAAGNIESETGLSNSATNPYAIMAYVNGYGLGFESNPAWGPGGTYSYVDDIGFIKNLINNLTGTFCIDTGRIFALGHSNGGGFTNVLACDPVLSVSIAAFAANSGAFYTNATTGDPATIEPLNTPVQPLCSPGRNNVPFLELHGTADTQIKYWGDTQHNGRILPTLPHFMTDWSVRQGYGIYNYSTTPAANVTEYQFGGNAGQLGIVTHYMLTGWIHAWAAVSSGAPMDATPAVMNFFYTWSNPNRAVQNNPASVSSSSSSTSMSLSTVTSSTVSSSSSSSMTTTSVSTSTSSVTSSVTSSTISSSSSSSMVSTSSSSMSSIPTSSTVSSSSFSSTVTMATSTSSLSISSSQSGSVSSSSSVFSSSSSAVLVTTTTTTTATSSSSSSSSMPSSVTSSTSSSATSPSGTSSQTSSTTLSSSLSSPSGSSSSSTASSSYTTPTLACPAANGQTYTDSLGIQYIIGCGADTNNGGAYVNPSVNSWDQCFYYCSTNYGGTSNCTTFTYWGGTNGIGPGMCYLKNLSPQGFMTSDGQHVAAVRVQNYQVGSYNPVSGASTSTATSTVSSGLSSQSISTSQTVSSSTSSPQATTITSLSSSNTSGIGTTSSLSNIFGTTSSTAATLSSSSSSMVIQSSASSSSTAMASSSQSSSTGASPSTMSSSSVAMQSTASSSSGASPSASISTSSSMTMQSTMSSASQSMSSSSQSSSASASCSSGATLTDLNGVNYTIRCNSDTTQGNFASQQFNGGDYTQCMAGCDSNAGCVAWTWVPYALGGGICFYKAAPSTFAAGSPGDVAGVLIQSGSVSSSSALSYGASSSQGSTSTAISSVASVSSIASGSTSASLTPLSTSSTPTASIIASCPTNNGQTITDPWGVQYLIGCGNDTTGGNYNVYNAPNGFSDCFVFCDHSQGLDSQSCTTFTYWGGSNGVGPGQCFVKAGAGDTFVAADIDHVAAIRISAAVSSTSSQSAMQATTSSVGSSIPASGSTGASMTSTSSAAGSSATSNIPQCPADANSTFTDPSGNQYMILCDSNTNPNMFNSSYEPDFGACIDDCAAQTSQQCVAVVYLGGNLGGNCYFKAGYTGQTSQPGCEAAVLLSAYDTNGVTTSSSASVAATASSEALTTSIMIQSTSTIAVSTGLSASSATSPAGSSASVSSNGNAVVTSSSSVAESGPQSGASSGIGSGASSGASTGTLSGVMSVASTAVTSVASSQATSGPISGPTSEMISETTAGAVSSGVSGVVSGGFSSSVAAGLTSSSTNIAISGNAASSSSMIIVSGGSGNSESGSAGASSTPTGAVSSAPSEQATASNSASGNAMTTVTPLTSFAASSATPSMSSTSTLPACPSQRCGSQSSDNTACADAYGNVFNVTCGTEYQGTITMRATQPNVGSCLTLCDTSPGCVAINYIGTECQLLSSVTGNITVPGASAAAATRPADVTTVYSTPPASTSASAPMTNPSPTMTQGGASMQTITSGGVVPASSPGESTPPTTTATTNNNNNSGGVSTVIGGETSFVQTGGPSYGTYTYYTSYEMGQSTPITGSGPIQSQGGSSGTVSGPATGSGQGAASTPASEGSGGNPGGSGVNTDAPSGMSGTMSGSMMTGSASFGSMTTNTTPVPTGSSGSNGGGGASSGGGGASAGISTSSASTPASSGPVCPNYDNEQYTDASGSTYAVNCNSAYTGRIIMSTNSTSIKHKRSSGGMTVPICMSYCDQIKGCVAINVGCDGTCTLFGSVSKTLLRGKCGTAAKRSSGPPPSGNGNVITVTVCAARTRTKTILTTATETTCRSNAQCTAKSWKFARGLNEDLEV